MKPFQNIKLYTSNIKILRMNLPAGSNGVAISMGGGSCSWPTIDHDDGGHVIPMLERNPDSPAPTEDELESSTKGRKQINYLKTTIEMRGTAIKCEW